jgi:hypothetical protein
VRFLYAVRYFHIVPVVPPLFVVAFAIVVVAGAMRLMNDPSGVIDALTPVLLLQLFVAASGFRFAARRGYYDLLLTSSTPRWQIALAHCLVSILPGIVSWLCIGALEVAASRGTHWLSIASGTCAACIAASLLAWGVAAFSSRTATTVVWLLVLTIPSIARVASPVQLVGTTWSTGDRIMLVTVCATALIAFGAAMVSIVRGSAPLEAAQ